MSFSLIGWEQFVFVFLFSGSETFFLLFISSEERWVQRFGWLTVWLLTLCYINPPPKYDRLRFVFRMQEEHLSPLCSGRFGWSAHSSSLSLVTAKPHRHVICLFSCTLMTEWTDCGSLQWLYFLPPVSSSYQSSQRLTCVVFFAFIKVYRPSTVTVCCITQNLPGSLNQSCVK